MVGFLDPRTSAVASRLIWRCAQADLGYSPLTVKVKVKGKRDGVVLLERPTSLLDIFGISSMLLSYGDLSIVLSGLRCVLVCNTDSLTTLLETLPLTWLSGMYLRMNTTFNNPIPVIRQLYANGAESQF